MTLRVLAPGLHTLVVDGGRPGYRSLGVPVGGAADRTALALGNALVGSAPDAAALEVTLAGPTLEAGCRLACVLYGAPFPLHSDRHKLIAGHTFTLEPGERLHIGATRAGMRAYFCVQGGLQVPLVLGSRSALAPLTAGAELPCRASAIHRRFVRVPADWNPCASRALQLEVAPSGPPVRHAVTLRTVLGAQADWFHLPDFFGAGDEYNFRFRAFEVTPASNRMGIRLQGEPLGVPERELVSEPVCPGSVQVTRDGQCILLGVDGQTIGGYPKIAQVISADLDELGQLRPGDRVSFVQVPLAEAERLWLRKQAELHAWLRRVRVAEVFP